MENTEFEIDRRVVESVRLSFKIPIIISLCWLAIGFIVNCIVGICNGSMFEMFWVGGLYWIGFGNSLLGLFLASIFALLQYLPTTKMELVLTNKRVYISRTVKTIIFKKTITTVESHNLDKAVSYEFEKISRKNTVYYSKMSFKTPASHLSVAVDEDFYNKFIAAVNNAC